MGGGQGYSNPFEIFEQFFSGGGGGFGGMGGGMGGMRSRAQPGNDERYDLVLDFSEAVFGCRQVLFVDRRQCLAGPYGQDKVFLSLVKPSQPELRGIHVPDRAGHFAGRTDMCGRSMHVICSIS